MPERAFDLTRLVAVLLDRHAGALTRAELCRALRALSARYVEGRAALAARAPADTAGKRAAFAVFHGPLHFVTTRAIVGALALDERPLDRVVDLGCGTGLPSAAWALAVPAPAPRVLGFDRNRWAVAEARWTWRAAGVQGRAMHTDLVAGLARLGRGRLDGLAVLAAWTVNELPRGGRDALLDALRHVAGRGAAVLVIEPVARRVAPWWPAWADAFETLGGRHDTWELPNDLPEALIRLDRDAGFDRPTLKARSLFTPGVFLPRQKDTRCSSDP